MNWKTLTCVSALTVGLAAAAYANDAVGTITEMDASGMLVTLDDGNTYDFSLPECRSDNACALGTFQVGDKVTIVWNDMQNKRMAQTISPVVE